VLLDVQQRVAVVAEPAQRVSGRVPARRVDLGDDLFVGERRLAVATHLQRALDHRSLAVVLMVGELAPPPAACSEERRVSLSLGNPIQQR
jgi:hypothetical protein